MIHRYITGYIMGHRGPCVFSGRDVKPQICQATPLQRKALQRVESPAVMGWSHGTIATHAEKIDVTFEKVIQLHHIPVNQLTSYHPILMAILFFQKNVNPITKWVRNLKAQQLCTVRLFSFLNHWIAACVFCCVLSFNPPKP